jgi:hypothetical protein
MARTLTPGDLTVDMFTGNFCGESRANNGASHGSYLRKGEQLARVIMSPRVKKVLKIAGVAGVAVLLLIQLVPRGRDHENPAVVQEPNWDKESTRDLAVRACFDCHSNETRWPWYSHIAPVSWLVQHHVDEGRAELNFSEWNKKQGEAHEAAKEIEEGEMPPRYYTLTHPEARLSAAETQALAASFRTMFGDEDDD